MFTGVLLGIPKKEAKVKLVRFSCGCVGTEPVEGISIIFTVCDHSFGDNEILFYESNRCSGKTYEPLDSDETRGIIEKTSRLISNGYDFREMKRLMG